MPEQNISNRKNSIFIPVILAGLFWTVYTLFLDDFLATDLRLISSVLAEKFLNFFNVTIQRNGTVLFGRGFTFEVIGACSGSTTLKVMTGAAIFLGTAWQNIRLRQRILFILLAVILAIIANALRVSTLVLISLSRGAAVEEGLLHNTIGIITFALTFLVFCILCRQISSNNRKAESTAREKSAMTSRRTQFTCILGAIILIYIPFLLYLFQDWAGKSWNKNNHWGVIYFILPLIIFFRQSSIQNKSVKYIPLKHSVSVILFTLSMLFPAAAAITDVKMLSGFGLLILLSSLISMHKGLKSAFLASPLLLIMFLGFPRIPLRLEDLINSYPLLQIFSPESLRLLLGSCLLILQSVCFYSTLKDSNKQPAVKISSCETADKSLLFYLAASLLTLLVVIISASGTIASNSRDNALTGIKLPYLLDQKWLGKDLPLSRTDIAYFGSENIINREYQLLNQPDVKTGNNDVEVLITSSAGDRHKSHPPEFCQSGSGWEVTSKEKVLITAASRHSAVILTLKKDDMTRYMLYWFSDTANNRETNFSLMMLDDIFSRFSGTPPEWLIIRLFCSSREYLLDFAACFPVDLFSGK